MAHSARQIKSQRHSATRETGQRGGRKTQEALARLHSAGVAKSRRRARIRSGMIEKVDYPAIVRRDNSICHICNKAVSAKSLSFDHVIPLAKGGNHSAENIKVAHRRCNSQKGTRIILDKLHQEVDSL